MKRYAAIQRLFLVSMLLVGLAASGTVGAATSGVKLDSANIDLNDVESLRRGAEYFANYCFNCHSIFK